MQSIIDEDKIAKQISTLLLHEKKSMSLEKIQMELKDEAIDREVLNSIFSKYSKYFQLVQEPMVTLVTKVDICKKHCAKDQDCTGASPCCTGLHICKFYLLSGNCEWGKNCRFGHNLYSDHNIKILRENLLVDISVEDVRYLLGLTALTIPRICKFYNVDKNKCRHANDGSICPDLHVCKHYIPNTCRFRKNCKRSHALKEERNKNILSRHGIDVSKSEQEILHHLRSITRYLLHFDTYIISSDRIALLHVYPFLNTFKI